MSPSTPLRLPRIVSVLGAFAAIALSSCADGSGPAGPGDLPSTLTLAPSFTFAGAGVSAETDGALQRAWEQRDAWLVDATANPSGRDALDPDTTIQVSGGAGADEFTVVLQTQAGDESYDLRFTALDAGGAPLFEVEMRVSRDQIGEDAEPVSPPPGELEYVGPGADATEVRIVTELVEVVPGESQAVDAVVLDEQGNEIQDVPLGWSSLAPQIAEVDEQGVVTGVGIGTTRVVVSTPTALTDTVDVLVVNPLVIFPEQVERLPGGTFQFTVEGAPEGSELEWLVNGVVGGDATFGTITQDGFYQAPEEVPAPDSFPVCVRFAGAPGSEVCATMVIRPTPTAGEDLVVINDVNPFDESGMNQGVGNPNNHIMVRNMVSFTGDRIRSGGTVVLWDTGRGANCASFCTPTNYVTMASIIQDAGFTIQHIQSSGGTLTEFPPEAKVIFLWNPQVTYTVEEVNALKLFAQEGGRIVFIGEYAGFYGTSGIAVENQLLADMGAEMVNVGNAVECGYVDMPGDVLREHQITEGMTAVRIACSSIIQPGPNDFVLYTDRGGTNVLAGVAKIDVVPIDQHQPTANIEPTETAPSSSPSGVDLQGGP